MPRVQQVNSPGEMAKGDFLPNRGKARVILGLDLGTNCGYCYSFWRPGHARPHLLLPEFMGQWDLSAGPYDSGAIRFLRLRHFLEAVMPNMVAYEDVKFTPAEALTRYSASRVLARAATASELIGAFRATVATWCEEHDVPCTGFPIGAIKKRATGKGNVGKEEMVLACNKLFGTDFDPKTYEQTGADNVADAAFVNLMAAEGYAAGL